MPTTLRLIKSDGTTDTKQVPADILDDVIELAFEEYPDGTLERLHAGTWVPVRQLIAV